MRGNGKRIISALILFTFLITALVGTSMPASAASKWQDVELKANSLVILEGSKIDLNTALLTIDGKIKWSSSNEKVAVVDKAGYVEGIAPGTAIISCKITSEKKTASIDVTVIEQGDESFNREAVYAGNTLPSVNMQNFNISEEDIVITNSKFTMNIPKGLIYPNKIEQYVLTWMNLVEKTSGLSFYPKGKEYGKVVINVDTYAYGSIDGITVAPMDLWTDDVTSAWVFMHELSHTLDMRNGKSIILQPFYEGFVITNSLNALNLYGRPDVAGDIASRNYLYFPDMAAALEDFETYYSNVQGWEAYLSGFRFSAYLQNVYGNRIFKKIIENWGKKYGEDGWQQPVSSYISMIKECTSQSVFEDFTSWYNENLELFEEKAAFDNNENSASNPDEAQCLPIITDYVNIYPTYKFDKVTNLTLDFSDGYGISQFNGFDVIGITGQCFTSLNVAVSFYDADWNYICTKYLEQGFNNIDVRGAAKIVISGNGGFFNILPNFEQMAVKR